MNKNDFPILQREINGRRLVYLDNAATSQKPIQVIEAVSSFYKEHNANIHRGIHTLSEEASNMFDSAYKKTACFIGADHFEEIVFTQGTTSSINLVAASLLRTRYWEDGGEVIITEMEHHANILPWMDLLGAKKDFVGIRDVAGLKVAKVKKDGTLDVDHLLSLVTKKAKVVAVAQVSNVLGTINPIKEIVKAVKAKSDALVLVDGAQAAPHMKVNVKGLGCDFYVFSSHKMLGPTGVGILWTKKEILDKMPPVFLGGGMIKEVHFDRAVWDDLPNRFVPGTPNISGVVGFSAALDYLSNVGMGNITEYEDSLCGYALDKLSKENGIEIYGPLKDRSGVISFNVKGIPSHDLASILDMDGIAIRTGHHCAMPLHLKLGVPSSARASVYLYNEEEDIDALIEGIRRAQRIFNV